MQYAGLATGALRPQPHNAGQCRCVPGWQVRRLPGQGDMIGILSPSEITALVARNRVARLAVALDNHPYVVPITYGYDGSNLYGVSAAGRKIDVMRRQPRVSVLVDEISGPNQWRSVVIDGTYEELVDLRDRELAAQLISGPDAELVGRGLDGDSNLVVFRIRPACITGRFERTAS